MLPALLALLALWLVPGLALVAAPWPAVPLLSVAFWLCSWGLTDLLGLSREAALRSTLLLFGLLNGLLPCGLVYAALAGAAATGGPLGGALFMAAFGLGTIPAMLAVSLAGRLITAPWRARFQRAVPVAMAVLAVLFIVRGLSLGIPYLSPDLSPEAVAGGRSCCH